MSHPQLCTMHCGRETGDTTYVCHHCGNHLRRLLEQLADTPTERPTVPIDRRPNSPHGRHRRPTGDHTIHHGLATDLELAITRQTRFTTPNGASRSATTPLPYNPTASDAAWVLRNVLTTWGDDIAERRGYHPPINDIRTLAPWMLNHIQWLRQQPNGHEAIEQITDAIRLAIRTIDRPADRTYAGRCDALIANPDGTPGKCPQDLYGRPGTDHVECPTCGTNWPITERRNTMLDKIRTMHLPAAELARAVNGILGIDLSVVTIRSWKQREHIKPTGVNEKGQPVYLVNDVINRALGHTNGRIAS